MAQHKQYSKDFKDMIVELYNSGKSSTEICQEYGISQAHEDSFDIKMMSTLLNYSRSTYYDKKKTKPLTKLEKEDLCRAA